MLNDFLKWAIWAGLVALVFVPFVVANNLFFPYITGKAFFFRIIVEIIFALWLILALRDKDSRPRFSWLSLGVTTLISVLFLADLLAEAPLKAFWSNFERMEGWVTFAHLFGLFFVLGSILKEKSWSWFWRLNIMVAVVLGIQCLSQGLAEGETRYAGPLGNPIYLAVYFLFIFFLTLIFWYRDIWLPSRLKESWLTMILVNPYLYLHTSALILSAFFVYRSSRGAFIGLLGGVFLTLILISFFEKKDVILRRMAWGAVVVVFILVAVFMSARNQSWVNNNPTLKRLAEISWSNIHGQARQLIWPMALEGFKEKPLLGWGQEGFNYVFNKYYDSRMYNQETWFDRAHNAPLDFLAAGGILGLLSYLGLFVGALYLLWFRPNVLALSERAILTGLLAGYFFQGLFVFDNLVGYFLFFAVLAYIHFSAHKNCLFSDRALQRINEITNEKEYQNYIIVPGIIILFVGCLWWVNYPAWSANRDLIQALTLLQKGQVEISQQFFERALAYNSFGQSEIREQLMSYAVPVWRSEGLNEETKKNFINLTINELQQQINQVPDDARYQILMGSLLNNLGAPEQALPFIKRAVELSPKKQTMRFELINSLYMLGRKAEALSEAKATYELAPEYKQAKDLYDSLLKAAK